VVEQELAGGRDPLYRVPTRPLSHLTLYSRDGSYLGQGPNKLDLEQLLLLHLDEGRDDPEIRFRMHQLVDNVLRLTHGCARHNR
jgi:hypothetical protein